MANPALPDYQTFCTSTSLYQTFELEEADREQVYRLLFYPDRIDCYCPYCDQISIFGGSDFINTEVSRSNIPSAKYWPMLTKYPQIHSQVLVCSRSTDHRIFFIFQISNKKLSKIGQYPSHSDLNKDELKKFAKVVSKPVLEELKRAHYLFAHGIGVGAFVYLRRVVEIYVIRDAHDRAKASQGWDEDDFSRLRVSERISKLSSFLPEIFTRNAVVYGIISKGIHELSEEDCLTYFPIINSFLVMVLTQLKAIKEQQELEREVQRQIHAIASGQR